MIILASNSWMKKTILEKSEYRFETAEADIDEGLIQERMKKCSHEETCMELAKAKAKKIYGMNPDAFIVAADTFGVLADGTRLAKPENREDQIALCLAQSGKTTTYYTGIAIQYRGKLLADYAKSDVTYAKFNRRTIERILSHDGLVPCNGGLGFSVETPGFTLVEKYEGSYTGAMGLPMEILRKWISAVGYCEQTDR